MNFFRIFLKWQFWASLVTMGLLVYGLFHFVFSIWLPTYTLHKQEIELPDLSGLTVHDATKRLDSLKLTYEIDSARYDSAHAPHSIIEFFPEKGFKVKQGRRILIKSNPSGWRPTSLPDIVGKSKRLAFSQLQLSGLYVGDTIYEPDLARDAVLRVMFNGKEIAKGTELPRFAKVDLVLGLGLEYGVKMDDFVGMTLDQAKASILASRYTVGMLNVEGNFTDSSFLYVFYQYPLARDYYDQGLPVDLWLYEVNPESKDSLDLRSVVKNLDRQFRNFGENDSIAIENYARELGVKEREDLRNSDNKESESKETQLPEDIEKPDGIEID